MDSSAFLPSIDADLQCFFNECFIDTDSDDDDVEFGSEVWHGGSSGLTVLCSQGKAVFTRHTVCGARITIKYCIIV